MVRMFERLDYDMVAVVGLNPRKMSFGSRVLNLIFSGLLEDTRFPQFLCKVSPRRVR
jgi:hypothetical protein